MVNYPPLKTRRLLLRPLESADAEQIQQLFPRWEVVRYLANKVPWPYPEDGAKYFVEHIALPDMAAGKLFAWSLRLHESPEALMGVINLRLHDKGKTPSNPAEVENRGFWLAPEYQGHGYMTEAAEAVTDYWFDVLKQPALVTTKVADNNGSRGISVRTGMRLAGQTRINCVGGDNVLTDVWEMTYAEWLEHKAGRENIYP